MMRYRSSGRVSVSKNTGQVLIIRREVGTEQM
jgi:hypothetical protein